MVLAIRRFVDRLLARPLLASAHGVLTVGTVAAAAVALASWVVGGIGSVSHLWQIPAFAWVRQSSVLASLAASVVVIGVLAMALAWLMLWRLVARRGREGVRLVVRAAVCWGAPLMLALPMSSSDVFAYLGQGRLVNAGLDPYDHGVSLLPGWAAIGVDPMWSVTPTPYGPVWLLFERFAAGAVLPTTYLGALLLLRLVAVGGLIGLGAAAAEMATERGHDPVGVLWLLIASPLVLVNFVLAAHNDAVMLALILVGLLYAARRRPVVAVAFIAAAMGIKVIAVVALPAVGLYYVGLSASFWRKARVWAITLIAALGSLLLVGFAIGVGPRWLWASVSTPAGITNWYAPVSLLGLVVKGVAATLGLDASGLVSVIHRGFSVLGVGIGAWILLHGNRRDPAVRVALAMATVVLFSPVIHPWYVLWVITLLACAGLIGTVNRRFGAVIVTFGLVMSSLLSGFWMSDAVPVWVTGIWAWLTVSAIALLSLVAWHIFSPTIDLRAAMRWRPWKHKDAEPHTTVDPA